jgi:DNA polymerase-3 subunit epsilon
MENIFSKYNKILVFDTETTGISCKYHEIIQFSSVMAEMTEYGMVVSDSLDLLITLSPEKTVPPEITKLTGITQQDIDARGVSKKEAARAIAARIQACDLLAAYNAQFDLTFLFYLLSAHGDFSCLAGKDKLDLLTVYKDRRPYPHRLCNAIEGYGLTGVSNSHQAQDDALAAARLMEAMEQEKQDLISYVNLFGYNPKYGVPRPPIRSITYKPQYYNPAAPLYL